MASFSKGVIMQAPKHFPPASVFEHSSMQALVDSPDMVRTVINFKRLTLTDIKIEVRRLARKKELKEAIEAGGKLPGPVTFCPALTTVTCSYKSRF